MMARMREIVSQMLDRMEARMISEKLKEVSALAGQEDIVEMIVRYLPAMAVGTLIEQLDSGVTDLTILDLRNQGEYDRKAVKDLLTIVLESSREIPKAEHLKTHMFLEAEYASPGVRIGVVDRGVRIIGTRSADVEPASVREPVADSENGFAFASIVTDVFNDCLATRKRLCRIVVY